MSCWSRGLLSWNNKWLEAVWITSGWSVLLIMRIISWTRIPTTEWAISSRASNNNYVNGIEIKHILLIVFFISLRMFTWYYEMLLFEVLGAVHKLRNANKGRGRGFAFALWQSIMVRTKRHCGWEIQVYWGKNFWH